MIERIGQIALTFRDVPAAVVFYRDVLGLQHLFDAGPALSFMQLGDVRLMFTQPAKPEFDHPASVLYLRVANIREAYATLKLRGVDFEDEPHLVAKMPDHELWMTFLRDPEDNLLGLMDEIRPAPASA